MKRFYNWFYTHYGSIEKTLGPELDMAVAECVVPLGDMTGKTALEHACGSGLFTLKIPPLFRAVVARDLSSGMLLRAGGRDRGFIP
jgi:ubiquinone/menaquinone biosynthesis C-methylase UbiE